MVKFVDIAIKGPFLRNISASNNSNGDRHEQHAVAERSRSTPSNSAQHNTTATLTVVLSVGGVVHDDPDVDALGVVHVAHIRYLAHQPAEHTGYPGYRSCRWRQVLTSPHTQYAQFK